MASVPSHQAEQPVFCQHLLKPIEHQPGAYRCVHCGQVGDMRDRTIRWREQNPDVAARDRGRAGGVSPEAVLGIFIAASVLVCTIMWCCRAVAGAAELQPIPREAAAEQDSGCCGGGPQGLLLCEICVEVTTDDGVTMTICDRAECDGQREKCRFIEETNDAGDTFYRVECVPKGKVQRRVLGFA